MPRAEIELELTAMRSKVLENCSTFKDNISLWSTDQLINYSADHQIGCSTDHPFLFSSSSQLVNCSSEVEQLNRSTGEFELDPAVVNLVNFADQLIF